MRLLRALGGTALLVALGCDPSTGVRAVPPELEPKFGVLVPTLDRSVMSSGLTVISTRSADFGVVRLELVMRAGYDFDPPEKAGVARVLGNLLALHALSPRNDVRFGTLGATPSITVDRNALTLAIEVMPADAAAGVQALADFVREPVPVAEYLDQARAGRRAAIGMARGSPDLLAALAMARIFSPWADRSGALGFGTEASLAAISAQDVEQHLASARNTRDAALVVVGPIEPMEPESWALAAFVDWPRSNVRAASGAARVAPRERRVVFVPVAGMKQSLIVVGGLRPRKHDDTAPAFEAALAMLMGRIQTALREERRISYGIGRDVATEADTFAVPIRVRSDKTRVALMEIRRLLDDNLVTPSSQWLATMRNIALTSAMDDAQHGASAAAIAREVFLYGLGLAALEREWKALETLEPDQVYDAAARQLTAAQLGFVVVGDPAVRDQLGDDIESWSL